MSGHGFKDGPCRALIRSSQWLSEAIGMRKWHREVESGRDSTTATAKAEVSFISGVAGVSYLELPAFPGPWNGWIARRGRKEGIPSLLGGY